MIAKELTKSFGVDSILDKVSFIINEGEKVALVGVNGAGKTTLFKMITGELSADSGSVSFTGTSERSVGYLSQSSEFEKNTILEEFYAVFEKEIELERTLRQLEQDMTVLEGSALKKTMERYSRLSEEFERRNGYEMDSRIKGVINGLGFSAAEAQAPLEQFSGGQKTRISLGKLLLGEYELLLLDEPTNHLDIEAIRWLEGFLRDYRGSVFVISHDRYFLDRIVSKVIEIENKKAIIYNGNYTDFAKKKANDREVKLKQYLDQQKEIKRQEEVIRQLRSFNREKSIKRAESREKMLEKLERVEKPSELPDKIRLKQSAETQSGQVVLETWELSKSYDNLDLFSDLSIKIMRGEHVALIGPNGVGKTTLFRILLGKIPPNGGELRFGSAIKLGYYDQEHQNLNPDNTIFEEISDSFPKLTAEEIRNTLAAFVFTGDDVFKSISSLSGGERGRVALAKIILSKANFLLLDEPTNHLDIYSKEILEKFLQDFEGAVFYISHDRYFINNTAHKIIEMTPNGVNNYYGNYDYYLEKSAEKAAETAESVASPESLVEDEALSEKNDWLRRKEEQAEVRRKKNLLQKTEAEIESLENELKACEDQLSSCDHADFEVLNQLYEKKLHLEERLNEALLLWEELS